MLTLVMHANAECQTDPNKSGDCTLLLTAEIEHQKTTISSLRILLEQHREEIEGLQKLSLDCSDKKENCDNQGNFRVADLERKLRFSETKVVKLAAEIHRLETEKRSMESAVSTMKSRVRSVMMDRDLAQSHLSASESTVQKHLDQITSLSKTISSLKDTLANSKSLISNLEAKLTTMIPKEDHNNIVEDLTNRIEDLLSDGLEASHIRSRLETDLKSATDQNHALTHKLDSCNQSLSRLRDEISSLQSESESKQRKIDSFEAEFNRLRKSFEQDQQSLESSHAIALALAEQSAAGALSRASVASSALELTQRRLNEFVSENERLRNDAVMSNIKPLVSSVSSQTTFERESVSIQIEAPSTEVQQVQTETVQFVTKKIQDLCLCSKCNSSIHDFSLFPCGHGLCVECCESLIVADEISLGGISCDQCEDKLPVTRIIRNRPLERLANLLTCSNT